MLDLPHTTQINGQTVRHGSLGEGEPLVAVHGTPFSSQVWRRIAPQLADRFEVFYFDLLGYGQSEMHHGQDVSLGVQNGVLRALMDEWGLHRPHLLAHDFGGATALRGYFLDGLRFRSATLFDAVALSPWGSPFVQHVRQHQSAFEGLPATMHRALLDAYLQSATHDTLAPDALDTYAAPWLTHPGQAAFYRQIAQMDMRYTDEVEPQYALLDCPTQVLWGVEDAWLPHTQGDRLAELLSDRPCLKVPGAGHLMQEDRPEAIVAAVLKIADSAKRG